MKIKLKNILMISFLAVAGIFGVSSAVINNQVKETPVAEKAEAWSGGETICMPGSFNGWSTSGDPFESAGQEYGYYQWTNTISMTDGDTFRFFTGAWYNTDEMDNTSKPSGAISHPGNDSGNYTVNNTGNYRMYFKAADGKKSKLYYEMLYTVTANSDNTTMGTATGSASDVVYGNTVTLTATPKSGYHFVEWKSGGSRVSTNATYTPTITADKTYTAYFAADVYYNVDKYYLVDGNVGTKIGTDSVLDGATWSAPSQTAYAGYTSNGWYKSDKTTSIPTGITITADTTVYSKYTRAPKNMHLRSKSTSWATDCAVSESVTFGDSYVSCSVSKTLRKDEEFKFGNSNWSIKFGPGDNDTSTKTFYDFLTGLYPTRCIDRTGTASFDNYICRVAGTYTFSFKIYANGDYSIDNVTRSPSGTVSIKYYKVIDGKTTQLGSTVTLWKGLSYNADDSKAEGNVFGYDNDYWYTQPIASNTYKYTDGTALNSDINLYQVYTRQEYKTYFFETGIAAESNADWRGGNGDSTKLFRIWVQDSNGVTQHSGAGEEWVNDNVYYPIYSSDTACVYSAYLPVGSSAILHVTTGEEYNGSQTNNISLDDATDETMCWRITSKPGGDWHWSGAWTAFEAGYSLVTSSGATVANMTTYESSSNLAAVYDVSLNSGDNLNVKIDISIGGSLSLDTLLYGIGDDAKTTACAQVTGSNTYFTMKTTSKFNFYLNQSHIIYIENETALSDSGILYLNNGNNWSNIYVYAYYESSGEHATLGGWPGTRIDFMENVSPTVNLDYRETGNIYKVLIAKLSGTSATKATKVIFNDGTKGTKDTAVAGTNRTGVYTFNPSATGSPIYYSDCTGSSDTSLPTATTASAPVVAYDIEVAIRNAPNQSVCNIEQSVAQGLCTRYDAVSSTIASSTITSWTSKYSGSFDWPLSKIRVELGNRAGDGYRVSGSSLFRDIFGNSEDNFSTIIIIISSSVALLSVTALSILVIRKRKSKEQE